MARELDQAARRAHIILTDQFGRKWDSTQDVIARGTCAPINPKFKDPLNTPQKFLKADVTTLSLYVDLEAWVADLEYAHKTYEQKLMDDSLMLFGENGMRMYTERAPALMRYTGEPPQPIEPVKAAMQGNKFCLGLTDVMPKWAEKHFVKATPVAIHFPDAEDEERFMDLEEEADKEALGGKKVNPRKNNTRTAEAA